MISVNSFVAQLESTCPIALKRETTTILKPGSCLRDSCAPSDEWHLRSNFGTPFRCRGLSHLPLASQARVANWGDNCFGGFQAHTRASQCPLLTDTDHTGRPFRYQDWFNKRASLCLRLRYGMFLLLAACFSPSHTPKYTTRDFGDKITDIRVRASTQKIVHILLPPSEQPLGVPPLSA